MSTQVWSACVVGGDRNAVDMKAIDGEVAGACVAFFCCPGDKSCE